MKWNFILEKGLPPVDEDVIVYDHGSVYVASYTGRSVKARDGGRVPVWNDGQYIMGAIGLEPPPYPTHWMEIPKDPPKGQTEGMIVLNEEEIEVGE